MLNRKTLIAMGVLTALSASEEVAAQHGGAGEWNHRDTARGTRALVQQFLSQRWLAEFTRTKGRLPLIRIDLTRRSNPATSGLLGRKKMIPIAAALRKRLERSGKVHLPRSPRSRFDYLLLGYVARVDDRRNGDQIRHFFFALTLVDPRTGEKLWIGIDQRRWLIKYPASDWSKPSSAGKLRVKALPPQAIYALSGGFNASDAQQLAAQTARKLVEATSNLAQNRAIKLQATPIRNLSGGPIYPALIFDLLQQQTQKRFRWLVGALLRDKLGLRKTLQPDFVIEATFTNPQQVRRGQPVSTMVLTTRVLTPNTRRPHATSVATLKKLIRRGKAKP